MKKNPTILDRAPMELSILYSFEPDRGDWIIVRFKGEVMFEGWRSKWEELRRRILDGRGGG